MRCKCPNCQHDYEAEITADMAREHVLSFRIVPNDGDMLSPLHVGGMMRSFERLLVAIANDAGMDSFIGLKGLSMDEKGAVTISALIMRKTRALTANTGAPDGE